MHYKILIGQMDKKSFCLFSSNFLSNLSFFSMLAILTLYFTQSCGFSLRFSGLFMLCILIFSRAGRILLLPFLKNCTAKIALIISQILMCMSYFILYLTKIKIIMLIGFLVMGMGYGCHSVYVRSLIGMSSKLSYVQLSIFTNLSAAIGGLLAVYVFLHLAGEYVFLYSSLIMFISTLATYFLLPSEKNNSSDINMMQALRFILTSPGVLQIFILTILSWIMYVQIFSTLPLVMHNQLRATQFLGGLYATNTLMIVLFSMPLNQYLLKLQLTSYHFILSGFLFIGCGFLLLYITPAVITAYLSMILWTVGEILIIPTLNSSLSALTQGSERLHIFALNGVAIGLGEGIGMYLGTALIKFQPGFEINHVYLYLAFITLAFFLMTVALIPNNLIREKK